MVPSSRPFRDATCCEKQLTPSARLQDLARPVSKGLNGAAVASKRPIIVQDVSADPRYLTTIGGTRGEMIQPILGSSGAVVGTIDVEADRVNAFTARDEALLAECAEALRWLWT
jgi:putative methionine-R-sulfoxide reductase with GAF domain